MALQLNYVHDDFTYPEAYVRIIKIRTSKTDFERFILVEDANRPDIAEQLVWESKFENIATFYVYSDVYARKNGVTPIHYGSFEFEYDLAGTGNIYSQAYDKLKSMISGEMIDDV